MSADAHPLINLERLKEAEATFLQIYPRGFSDPALQAVRKKHNVDQLVSFTQQQLTRARCQQPHFVADTMLKIVSRSSMVSRFEKPRFRDFVGSLSSDDRDLLAYAVEQRLFGRKQQGFEILLDMLRAHRIAKWAVISAVPFYHAPRREVFVKPTTTKGILALLEVDHVRYQSTPSWAFYKGYQSVLREVRKHVHSSLFRNYAALSGFLMMSMRADVPAASDHELLMRAHSRPTRR